MIHIPSMLDLVKPYTTNVVYTEEQLPIHNAFTQFSHLVDCYAGKRTNALTQNAPWKIHLARFFQGNYGFRATMRKELQELKEQTDQFILSQSQSKKSSQLVVWVHRYYAFITGNGFFEDPAFSHLLTAYHTTGNALDDLRYDTFYFEDPSHFPIVTAHKPFVGALVTEHEYGIPFDRSDLARFVCVAKEYDQIYFVGSYARSCFLNALAECFFEDPYLFETRAFVINTGVLPDPNDYVDTLLTPEFDVYQEQAEYLRCRINEVSNKIMNKDVFKLAYV